MASPEEQEPDVQPESPAPEAEAAPEAIASEEKIADEQPTEDQPSETVSADELLEEPEPENLVVMPVGDAELKAVLEAIIYVTDEPLSLEQICSALLQPQDRVLGLLDQLAEDYERPDRGLTIREVAGGYKMATKPEHHEGVRRFVKNLNPPLKLSLPALETLAVIAYKQPITAPEIMDIRGVQGAGVLKTLVERRLITTAGRKQVLGKPILYKTTREFLVQFGLRDLAELPTLKEFQELARFDTEPAAPEPTTVEAPATEVLDPEMPPPPIPEEPTEFQT
ncbi:MAG: condensin subunit ScpB [Bryobacterales bacterium]|nr:condensin subunit ScpB [Bryobacterales bacterium]